MNIVQTKSIHLCIYTQTKLSKTKSIHIYQHKPSSTISTQSKIKIKIRTQTQIKHKNTNSDFLRFSYHFLSTKHKHKLISNKNTKTSQTQQSTINKPTPRPTPTTDPPFDPPPDPTDHYFTTIDHHHRFLFHNYHHTDLNLSLNPDQNYGRLWRGEEIRRGEQKVELGRERHQSETERPMREKDIDLSHRVREQSTDLSEELEAFRFGFGFKKNQEIKRMGQSEKEKKKHHNQLWWWRW